MAELFRSLIDEGKTLMIVTHDSNLAALAHRVLRLTDGAIAADEDHSR